MAMDCKIERKIMNIKIFYILFLFHNILSAVPVNDRNIFDQANYLFEEEKYEQACQLYQSIENKGFIVLYNMSLSYVHAGDHAHALLYAKRAEKLANFTQLTLLYEYFMAMKKNVDPDYQPYFTELVAIFVKKCILSIHILLLQLLLLIFFIICIVCWHNRHDKIYKNILLYMVFFIIIFGSLWLYKNNYMHRSVGIIMQDNVAMFAGPDTSFYEKTILHKADEIVILDTDKKYYKVQAKNIIGWILNTSIELV